MDVIQHSYEREIERKMAGLNVKVKNVSGNVCIDVPIIEGSKETVSEGMAKSLVEQALPEASISSVEKHKDEATRITLKKPTEMTE